MSAGAGFEVTRARRTAHSAPFMHEPHLPIRSVPGPHASSPLGVLCVPGSLIERLHGLGISFVVVAGPEAVARSKAPAERLADLERRFTGHETDPLMTRLKQIVSARISESAQE